MKLCKTCKHCAMEYVPLDSCSRSVRVVEIDMRNGDEIKAGWKSTYYERESGYIMARLTMTCGKEGRFWEAKL